FWGPFPQKGENPGGFKPRGFKRGPFGGFKTPKFSPGENFSRGKIFGGPFFPKRGKTRGFLKPPGVFKRGPLLGVLNPKIFPGGKFFPGGKILGAPFSPKGGKPRGFLKPRGF
ncbi:hypothetical protein C6983_27020, partial [Escherichia coli]